MDLPSPMPPYISLNRPTSDQFEFEKPHSAGPQHGPFRPFGDSLADLKPAKSLDLLNDRRSLLASFDTLRRDLDRPDNYLIPLAIQSHTCIDGNLAGICCYLEARNDTEAVQTSVVSF